jgi:hypothetical protein
MIEDPRLVVLPRGIRLLAIEALVWSKLHQTDGYLPRAAVVRMTDEPEPLQAAEQLEEAGIWEPAEGGGWQIVGFTDTQMSAARVRQKRDGAKVRYDEWLAREDAKRVGNAVGNGAAPPAPPAPPRPASKAGGGKRGGRRTSEDVKENDEDRRARMAAERTANLDKTRALVDNPATPDDVRRVAQSIIARHGGESVVEPDPSGQAGSA